jgi:hypothetical protein
LKRTPPLVVACAALALPQLDPTGASLVYSTYLGGTAMDAGYAVAVDASGSAYVTGRTYSSDFPTTSGAVQTSRGALSDAFVTKLESSGSSLGYSTFLGGNDFDWGFGIALDSAGNAYVTGQTSSTDFPATVGAFQVGNASTGTAEWDAFVTKFDPAGSLAYSTYLGGTNIDLAYAIAVDAAGHAHVTGETGSTDFPTLDAVQPALDGLSDVFVTELNPAGSALVHSTYLGGSDSLPRPRDDLSVGEGQDHQPHLSMGIRPRHQRLWRGALERERDFVVTTARHPPRRPSSPRRVPSRPRVPPIRGTRSAPPPNTWCGWTAPWATS